jgi:hypothetical protein
MNNRPVTAIVLQNRLTMDRATITSIWNCMLEIVIEGNGTEKLKTIYNLRRMDLRKVKLKTQEIDKALDYISEHLILQKQTI